MTTITRQPMDACPCGKAVEKFTLKNAQGAYVEISSLGGTIMSIHVPDKDGKLGDVTLRLHGQAHRPLRQPHRRRGV